MVREKSIGRVFAALEMDECLRLLHQFRTVLPVRIKGMVVPTELLKEYDATLDAKGRLTIRSGAGIKLYKKYRVSVFGDGRILLEPRVPIHQKAISKRTIQMMDAAVTNYTKGIRSRPINTDEMRRIADALPG